MSEEVKIIANNFGTLFAKCEDGRMRTILVDVHDAQHYGVLTLGSWQESIIRQYKEGEE